jgi:hypothetical protein
MDLAKPVEVTGSAEPSPQTILASFESDWMGIEGDGIEGMDLIGGICFRIIVKCDWFLRSNKKGRLNAINHFNQK